MNKLIIIIFFLSFSIFGNSQNLVPNFSFEIHDTCPTFGDQIQYAIGWNKYSDNSSTPDYYNTCSPSNAMGVPQSFYCYQNDSRGCSAYAGLGTWSTSSNTREFVGIQLNSPLIIGQKYFISFKCVLGEYSDGVNQYGLASNKIGVRLSTVEYSSNNPCPIDNFAHLFSSSVITDSINWNRVSGSIVADSAYNYIVIGNFFDDSNTDTINFTCGSCFNLASYYLVDDVCLSTDSLFCNNGIDLLSCNVSIPVIHLNQEITISPNPAKDYIITEYTNGFISKLNFFDLYGKLVYTESQIENNYLYVNLNEFKSGIYFLKFYDYDNNIISTKKIIKQ